MARAAGIAEGNEEPGADETDRRNSHKESRGTYGWPRVHAELVLGLGEQVNRKRVARLMRQAGLQGIYRRKGRKNLVNAATEEDLVHRQFHVDVLNRCG
jgi:putative transposase